MEEKELDLVKSGLDASKILIEYLSKDSMGANFLKDYLANTTNQNDAVKKQQDALSELITSSKKIEEETAGIAERAMQNNERLSSIYSAVESLGESVNRIEAEYRKYNEQFAALIAQANEINKLVESIKDISAQTNLLSFNASIEAARAGNAGKGFRIIANEVKKLSDDTDKTSETIKQTVGMLVESISSLEKATSKNSVALTGLRTDAAATLENFEKVRHINSENNSNVGKVSGYVAENLENINTMISTVESVDKGNLETVNEFAKSASENEMLFNDLYSYAYQIQAIFEELSKRRQ